MSLSCGRGQQAGDSVDSHFLCVFSILPVVLPIREFIPHSHAHLVVTTGRMIFILAIGFLRPLASLLWLSARNEHGFAGYHKISGQATASEDDVNTAIVIAGTARSLSAGLVRDNEGRFANARSVCTGRRYSVCLLMFTFQRFNRFRPD